MASIRSVAIASRAATAIIDKAFLFISHEIAFVERVSHRIAVMYQSEIVEIGPTDQVLRRPQHDYTRKLLSAVPVSRPRTARATPVTEPAA